MTSPARDTAAPGDASRVESPADHYLDDIQATGAVPFILVHLACLGAIWTGVYWQDVALAVGLYGLRMFGITGGYHRYFSHRAYKTSRWFQFILAFIAQTSAQRGILWWAAKHRHHHRYSDTPADVHSPAQRGFWYAHMGWIFTARHDKTDLAAVPDLAKFPELRFLDRFHYLPAFILAVAVWFAAGWSGLVVGFFWSTIATYHGTFCINSLAHVYGRRRYLTGDDSRNNWWFALLTMGEGWHNNHHAYQSAACQGFRWWEVDTTYYILKALSWVGVTWDLHRPPAAVVRGEQRLGKAIIEKAAGQLAATFHVEQIAARLQATLADSPSLADVKAELQHKLQNARAQAEAMLASLHMPELHMPAMPSLPELHMPSMPTLPTREELKERAAAMFVRTTSMDDIVDRARQLLIEAVCARLATSAA
ncbi:acyl-CoA desaturase [Nitrospirillum sp. BR 11164]|uniref:acyl-CoA desaturase n=1 Tax=Nitrospirillum sp. BR 11164 TaxID=3104324 RepID=UPI002AFF0A49|nr:acyl-CoA desaturase [Nitrospirillum sp. BR 11164]MEA1650081.1 acyl-CoA desaturase [Nitrospirillum sp. BR 11164]